MRTTPDENAAIGALDRRAAQPHGRAGALPDSGRRRVAHRRAGQALPDPAADAALFTTLERVVRQTPSRRLIRLPWNINDPQFANALVEHFRAIAEAKKEPRPHAAV